jgi:TP901 family phage tail tape measure protein
MADRTFKLKFLADIQQAVGQMDKLGDKVGSMSTKSKMIAGAAAAGGVAIGAAAAVGFKKAITLAADYEHAIDAVSAVAGASAAQEKQLYAKGRELGRRTAFTALESAAAMEELAAQGLTVDQIISGAADATVNLAAAGGTDLVTAATAIAGTMDIWKVKSDGLVDVTNRIAGAANFSKFGVDDMNQAIAAGGAVAKIAGVSYEDYLTTVALTASAFNSGSDAGTGLKTFFQTITGKSKEARGVMKQYGLINAKGQNLFYDAKGNFLGMANAADILHESLDGLSDFEKNKALTAIFGSDAVRAGAQLAERGRAGFEATDKGMGDTDAAAMAAKRLGNLKAALDQLKGSLEDIGIGLGEKFLPPLAFLARLAADVLPKIPSGLILVVGGFAIFIGMLSAFSLAVAPILLLLGTLGIGIGGVALAFLAIPAAIAAVIAAGYLLFTHWDEIKARAAGVRDAILSTVGLDQGPAATPAKKGVNALAAGAIQAIPIYGPLTNLIGGTKQLLGGGSSKSSMGMLSPEGYATGGMVPGVGPRLAIVHGGERVLTPEQQRGGGNITINMPSSGFMFGTSAEFARHVLQALNDQQQRGTLGLFQ